VTHHKAALDAAVANGAAVPQLASELLTVATAENFGYCTTVAFEPPAHSNLFTENSSNHGSNHWLSTLADGSDNEATPMPGAGRAGTQLAVTGPMPPSAATAPPLQPTPMRPTPLAACAPTVSGIATSLPLPPSMEPLAANDHAPDTGSKLVFEVPGAKHMWQGRQLSGFCSGV
jgi:hypothetical protein